MGPLASGWSSVTHVCRDLDEPQGDRATDCPGWSVKDNVAHMIGTERMLLGEQPAADAPSDAPHVRNDIGRHNEQWVESYRAQPGREVLAAFEAVTARRLETLRSMTAEA